MFGRKKRSEESELSLRHDDGTSKTGAEVFAELFDVPVSDAESMRDRVIGRFEDGDFSPIEDLSRSLGRERGKGNG